MPHSKVDFGERVDYIGVLRRELNRPFGCFEGVGKIEIREGALPGEPVEQLGIRFVACESAPEGLGDTLALHSRKVFPPDLVVLLRIEHMDGRALKSGANLPEPAN